MFYFWLTTVLTITVKENKGLYYPNPTQSAKQQLNENA